jgi:hypothetical protein
VSDLHFFAASDKSIMPSMSSLQFITIMQNKHPRKKAGLIYHLAVILVFFLLYFDRN